MKLRIALLFIIAASIIISCQNSDRKKQLVKTWNVVGLQTPTPLPDSVINRVLAGSEMTFTDDGHYTATGGIGADKGTYTFEKDGQNLSTVSEAGRGTLVYVINEISDDKMILSNSGTTVTCTAKK
ncbi:MAG: hypothetical protein K0S09_2884 [Sphingobacteriaceae bacterium]|jgi:hypothetical protein|nr:hypothetical protein [Sphingobacteriaceae bacterium]